MTILASDHTTLALSSTIDPLSAVFSPLDGVRISNLEITSTPIVRRPFAVHPWNEIMPHTGRKMLRLGVDGYFQASEGEVLLQQHALSGAPCLMKLWQSDVPLLQVLCHVLRFTRTHQPNQPETLRADLQSVGEVAFL